MNDDVITVKVKCKFCNSFHFINVKMSDYRKFTTGMLCKDYFPYLSEDDYNLMIFNICPNCFNDIFSSC